MKITIMMLLLLYLNFKKVILSNDFFNKTNIIYQSIKTYSYW